MPIRTKRDAGRNPALRGPRYSRLNAACVPLHAQLHPRSRGWGASVALVFGSEHRQISQVRQTVVTR